MSLVPRDLLDSSLLMLQQIQDISVAWADAVTQDPGLTAPTWSDSPSGSRSRNTSASVRRPVREAQPWGVALKPDRDRLFATME